MTADRSTSTSAEVGLRAARPVAMDAHMKRVAVVILLGLVMSILDTTIVNVALNKLSRDLHSSLADIQWVVSAYLLALAAVIPLSSWAVRRFGAFRVYVVALVLFTVGSVLCGLATSAGMLIAFRAVQGLGGGLMGPTGMTILIKAVGRHNLARVMSAMGIPMVLAPVFGPTLGGFLLQTVSWHAIFLINLPVGIFTVAAAARMLPRDDPEPGEAGPLDWVGLVLAAAGTVGVTYGLAQSATAGTFTSSTVTAPVGVGSAMLVAFVVRGRRVSQPLLDLRLYREKVFSCSMTAIFCLGAAMFATMVLLPLYFQDARGEDALQTGLLLMPQGLGGAIGMNRSAWSTHRLGAGPTALIGIVALVLGTLPFVFVTPGTPYLVLAVAMVLRGFGGSFAMMPPMTAAFAALDEDQVNDASPQLNVIQRVGGSFGTAVIAVVLQTNLAHAGGRPSALSAGFDRTYVWVLGALALSAVPCLVLWRLERRSPRSFGAASLPEDAIVEVV